MAGASYTLHQPLPPDVLVAGGASWARYRNFPVFSVPWLRGRTVLFAILIGAYGLLSSLGLWLASANLGVAALSGLYFFAAFMVMSTTGPALAAWVRHRSWPTARERTAVVAAIAVGVASSFLADQWASRYIEDVALPAAGMHPPKETRPPTPAAMVVHRIFLVLTYGLFGGGLALRAYFSEQRRWNASEQHRRLRALETEKQESERRLAILQAQVEPHFLFNTLASIRSLVDRDPRQAEASLDALVHYLRATIPTLRGSDGALQSTLGQQVDLCASYLAVMRVRMGDRLRVVTELPAPLRDRPFPPMMLISLVENAIKHGIEPRPGPGCVDIRAREEDGALVVSVADDGGGLQPGAGTGVGLANVRAQLQTRYGGRAALDLGPHPGGGVLAEIRIPGETT